MSIHSKFRQIITLHQQLAEKPLSKINPPAAIEDLQQIEELLHESLPEEVRQLYLFANGEHEELDCEGLFFGEKFLTTQDIIQQIKESKSIIKSVNNLIVNPELSERILREIVDLIFDYLHERNKLPEAKEWKVLKFQCSSGGFSGPYLYKEKQKNKSGYEIIEMEFDFMKKIISLTKNLNQIEKENYGWDELNFEVFPDRSYNVERSIYSFYNESNFYSTPENAIRKKYFHYKWVPVFGDYGGNFIGVDLDPDREGKKGQVINFGRDESDMVILAESLECLFDKLIHEFENKDNRLLDKNRHVHDILKDMARGKK